MNYKQQLKTILTKIIKTSCETAIGIIGTQILITEVDWVFLLNAVGLSAIVTLLINVKDLKI